MSPQIVNLSRGAIGCRCCSKLLIRARTCELRTTQFQPTIATIAAPLKVAAVPPPKKKQTMQKPMPLF